MEYLHAMDVRDFLNDRFEEIDSTFVKRKVPVLIDVLWIKHIEINVEHVD